MKQIIKYLLVFFPAASAYSQSELPVMTLDSIISRIDANNLSLQSYAIRAKSFQYEADASGAWMAPMAGLGTFMTPYPGQKILEDRDKGNIMIEVEQEIPNPRKQAARKNFIRSQAGIENANRDLTLNELRARSKLLFYQWNTAKKRIVLLTENEKLLMMIKKIEEVRYPFNQSLLSNVYRAEAAVEENRNMMEMQDGIISTSRSWLNALMNQPSDYLFDVATVEEPHAAPSEIFDTTMLARERKDIGKMNESIRSMQLNIQSMRAETRPDFKIRFDHMNPLSGMMPKAFSVMGMISIPIAPWSSGSYKSGIKAMEFNISAMERQRAAMLQETVGNLYGMQHEIQSMHTRVLRIEEKIIPALQKAMDAAFIQYQENKLPLPELLDSWEALNMMKLTLLDEQLKHYEMTVNYEKELFR